MPVVQVQIIPALIVSFSQNYFQWLTVRDAATMGFNKRISNYPTNTFLQDMEVVKQVTNRVCRNKTASVEKFLTSKFRK
jgi:hypothetical protein